MKAGTRLLASLSLCAVVTMVAATLTTQFPQAAGKATIQTDAIDYPPNTQVNVTGSGWLPGEVVELTFTETATTPPGGFTDAPVILFATSDDQGNIANGGFSTDQHDLGVHFLLTAKGTISGKKAQATFTDALATVFEISDGNTIRTSSHDWDQVYRDCMVNFGALTCDPTGIKQPSWTGKEAVTGAIQFTTDGVNRATDDTFYAGKDTVDISSWTWGRHGSPNDKTDLEHGFAAVYEDTGYSQYGDKHTMIYVGADRYASGSNSAISIWFLQHPIGVKQVDVANLTYPSPAFVFVDKSTSPTLSAEKHQHGDLLIQASLGSAATALAYTWICNPVDCSGTNNGLSPAITLSPTTFAINSGTLTVPWTFTDKTGKTGPAAQEFFEVGVDLNAVFQKTTENLPDFSSFIITSRTSASKDASLSDFILGNISSDADVTVSNTPVATPVYAGQQVGYNVTVSNVGVGTVNNVTLDDPLPLTVNWSISGPNPAGFVLSDYNGVTKQVLTLPSGTSVVSGAPLSVLVTGMSTPASRTSITSTAEVTGDEGANFTSNNKSTGTIVVNNNPPVANNDSRNTDFNVTTTYSGNINGGSVLYNDTDLEGDLPLEVATVKGNGGSFMTVVASGTTVSSATHGTVTIYPDGHFTYAPTPGSTTNDSFLYTVKDSLGQVSAAAATVTITIGGNNPPDAVNDGPVSVAEESTGNAINVLGNDTTSDPDETLNVTAVSDPPHGTAGFTATGVTYSPDPTYVGGDTFTYTISDGNGGFDTATVSITVTNVNDAPVAVDDLTSTNEDAPKTLTQADLKGNDTDIDNSNAQLSVTGVSNPVNGTVELNLLDGTVTFTPTANFNGTTAGFDYTLSDGELTDTGHVTVTVNAVNDAPANVSVNGATLDENGSYSLSGSFTDLESSNTHTVTIHWGDSTDTDTDTVINLGSGVTSFASSHQYLDDNPTATAADNYTVTVTVTDNSSGAGAGGATVTVNNVAPVIVMSTGTIAINLGDTFSRPGSFSDVGTLDTWTATVDYGDGAGPIPLTLTAGKTFSLTSPDYTAGTHTVIINVTDDDGEVDTKSFQVLVESTLECLVPQS
jgi:hypothetical protein